MANNRTFRVFVSSTFEDLTAERDALQKCVFPRLQKLCNVHRCAFQAIDLRWGVSTEAALDQQTMNICLAELRRCQDSKLRPNFIVLLGDRYGWIPLPPQIPAEELDELLDYIPRNTTERELLVYEGCGHSGEPTTFERRGWYRRDDNAVPGAYVLLSRALDVSSDAEGEVLKDAQERENEKWRRIESYLRNVLLAAIEKAGWPEGDMRRAKYVQSATHQEIEAGALSIDDAHEHVFAFLRGNHATQDDSLAALRSELLGKLGDKRVRKYDISMAALSDSQRRRYLVGLCRDVYASLSQAILAQVDALENEDDLTRETTTHEEFGAERRMHFIGRAAYLTQISDYLSTNSKYPLVICGHPGSGKSALMAKAASEAISCHGGQDKTIVRQRYIGATPLSTDIRTLLFHLCQDIHRNLGSEELMQAELAGVASAEQTSEVQENWSIPDDCEKLSECFRESIAAVPGDRKLILYLDALDQLSTTDSAHALTWLPQTLPTNVKLIVSVLETEGTAGKCLASAKAKYPQQALVHLEDMTLREGAKALRMWLTEAYPDTKRKLTRQQRRSVLLGFSGCRKPLYLRLVFEGARQWRSYDDPCCPPTDIPGAIQDLLTRLSSPKWHGDMLVRTFIELLCASRHGLAEAEILDLLSSDSVMDSLRIRSSKSPRTEGIPPVIWLRLRADLDPYLVERAADSTALLSFYHPQFRVSAGETWSESFRVGRAHRDLAEYFSLLADPEQDMTWTGTSGHAFAELLFHYVSGECWQRAYRTLTSPAFLERRFSLHMDDSASAEARQRRRSDALHALMADFDLAHRAMPDANLEDL